MHVYSDVQCMQAQRTNPTGHRGSTYRDKIYVQRTNHMGLWGHNACTKEHSYRDTRYLCVQRTNPMGIGCTNRGPILYVHVRALCQVRRTIYMGNPACTKRSCYKECFSNNAGEKLREWYRSSVHKPTQKCTQLNGIDPVHVTKCGVKVCHHHQTVPHVLHVSVGVVHKNMPYDGVQVYIRNNSSVCTSAGDCVSQHGCLFMYYA